MTMPTMITGIDGRPIVTIKMSHSLRVGFMYVGRTNNAVVGRGVVVVVSFVVVDTVVDEVVLPELTVVLPVPVELVGSDGLGVVVDVLPPEVLLPLVVLVGVVDDVGEEFVELPVFVVAVEVVVLLPVGVGVGVGVGVEVCVILPGKRVKIMVRPTNSLISI